VTVNGKHFARNMPVSLLPNEPIYSWDGPATMKLRDGDNVTKYMVQGGNALKFDYTDVPIEYNWGENTISVGDGTIPAELISFRKAVETVNYDDNDTFNANVPTEAPCTADKIKGMDYYSNGFFPDWASTLYRSNVGKYNCHTGYRFGYKQIELPNTLGMYGVFIDNQLIGGFKHVGDMVIRYGAHQTRAADLYSQELLHSVPSRNVDSGITDNRAQLPGLPNMYLRGAGETSVTPVQLPYSMDEGSSFTIGLNDDYMMPQRLMIMDWASGGGIGAKGSDWVKPQIGDLDTEFTTFNNKHSDFGITLTNIKSDVFVAICGQDQYSTTMWFRLINMVGAASVSDTDGSTQNYAIVNSGGFKIQIRGDFEISEV